MSSNGGGIGQDEDGDDISDADRRWKPAAAGGGDTESCVSGLSRAVISISRLVEPRGKEVLHPSDSLDGQMFRIGRRRGPPFAAAAGGARALYIRKLLHRPRFAALLHRIFFPFLPV